MKIVVLAGGVGSRLWPLSRQSSPKQVKPVLGEHTLLQKTILRLLKAFSPEDIFIVTGAEFAPLIFRQLPGFPRRNVLAEPARRNTTAAIGLAAYTIAQKSPEEIIVSIASDHFIGDEDAFLANLKVMEQLIRRDREAVVLTGIAPTYPETGYGYIECGRPLHAVAGHRVYAVKCFIEKPPLEKAKQYIRSKRFFWNPSYFAWRVDRVAELYRKFAPETDRLLRAYLAGSVGAFKKIESEAIDTAVMEKLTEHFYVVEGRFPWADVGHWASVKAIQNGDGISNVTHGLHHALDTSDSLIYNYTRNIVTTVGVSGLIVVQTENGTLVCHKDRAQDVKKLVEAMQQDRKLKRFL